MLGGRKKKGLIFSRYMTYEDLCENTALLGKYQGFGHSILAPRAVVDYHPMKNGTSRVLVHTFHQKKIESKKHFFCGRKMIFKILSLGFC